MIEKEAIRGVRIWYYIQGYSLFLIFFRWELHTLLRGLEDSFFQIYISPQKEYVVPPTKVRVFIGFTKYFGNYFSNFLSFHKDYN
jgi:hypothetical protein